MMMGGFCLMVYELTAFSRKERRRACGNSGAEHTGENLLSGPMQIPFYTTFGKRSGFSLVELVIVMAILAVLATIGVMSYGNSLL